MACAAHDLHCQMANMYSWLQYGQGSTEWCQLKYMQCAARPVTLIACHKTGSKSSCLKGIELTSSSKTPSRVMMRCSGILSSVSPAGTTSQSTSMPAYVKCLPETSAPGPARVPALPTFLHILGCHRQIDLLPCPLCALHCDLLLGHASALQQWSMYSQWKTSEHGPYQRLMA